MNVVVEYDGWTLRCPECGTRHEVEHGDIKYGGAVREYTFYCDECEEDVTLEVEITFVFRYEVSDDVLHARGTTGGVRKG